MSAVLSTEDSYFSSTSLRRSQSQTNFAHSQSSYRPSGSQVANTFHPSSKIYTDSDASSALPSLPAIRAQSTDTSISFTPASNLSISSDFEETLGIYESPEDHSSLPLLSQEKFVMQPEFQRDNNLEPPPSPKTGDPYTVSPTEPSAASGLNTPEVAEHAEDDAAVSSRPSRQVDYLCHDWREEDIWSSWRYIISKRGEFANSARLENASWRAWMKASNNLKMISPKELNWLKDCDVTWLYGPLQCCSKHLNPSHTEPSSVSLSKMDSFVNLKKKPILKKRSWSEIMLQVSASSVKQATAAVQAQETRGVLKHKTDLSNTDFYATFSLSTRRSSFGTNSSLPLSTESSNMSSPFPKRKHIHFNEQVEQCIAIDVEEDNEFEADQMDADSDADNGIMMKRIRPKKRGPAPKRRSRKSTTAEGKIIAKLSSTTLKYREDTPEHRETAMKHSTGVCRSPLISPSSCQETLRPTKKSSRFFLGDEDDDDDGMSDNTLASRSGWQSPPAGEAGAGLHQTPSTGSLSDDPAGMRRTPSGMLMPCEEGDVPSGDGILGRLIDTVNTARDITHVIWNVGWRK